MKVLIALVLLVAAASAGRIGWMDLPVRNVDERIHATPLKEDLPMGRITNGEIAKPGQFPYQVMLLLYLEDGAAMCGGSIISDRYILTAAHCTDGLSTGVDVYLGAWDRTDKNEASQQIIFVATKNVIVHEDWDEKALKNDISLIKLPNPIEFNAFIQPVKLPSKASTYPTYVSEMAIASGWGRFSDASQSSSAVLRYIEVPIMSNSNCNIWFLGSITANNICIKTTGGTSTCNGDSGGPLVLAKDKTLIGLTSFGISLGCEKGWPGSFTRVTSYLDWIQNHTGIAY